MGDSRPWMPEDDVILLCSIFLGEARWYEISTYFSNRSAGAVRNRWLRIRSTLHAPRKRRGSKKCAHCGQPCKGHTCWSIDVPAMTDVYWT